MSRAFVKEQDDVYADQLPDRPDSGQPNYITPKGLAALKERLLALIKEKRELGDNAPALRPELERDIPWLESRVAKAIVLDPRKQKADEVQFGATVDVLDENDKKHRFAIVGEDEADAAKGRISWLSPLAKSLLGAKVGDTVVWKRPAGDLELEVEKINYR
ncbi:MAG: GreA/GreB family elongation factor [Alphaproteobacteria bacterium]|nr:GreA/GreB family elongation factor [Alphaproteobacteria bacterium]